MKNSARTVLSVTLAANLSFVFAATPAIGVALSSGTIKINDAKAETNASLFEGSTVETGAAGSRLHLKNGADVQLATGSKGQIFQNRLFLEKGNTQVRPAAPFEVDTDVVKVSGAGGSAAQVSLHGGTVQVASLTGSLKVVNTSGVFLTTIAPGASFNFSKADAGAAGPQDPSQTGAKGPAGSSGAAGASGAGSGAGAGAGASTAMIVGGVVVAGAAVGVGTYYGTQGVTNPQSCTSPCQSH